MPNLKQTRLAAVSYVDPGGQQPQAPVVPNVDPGGRPNVVGGLAGSPQQVRRCGKRTSKIE